MKIKINFEHPYFDEETIFELTLHDLDCFYAEENEVNRLNLFFVLEASLHRFQMETNMKTAARCAFLMAYYLFVPSMRCRITCCWKNCKQFAELEKRSQIVLRFLRMEECPVFLLMYGFRGL